MTTSVSKKATILKPAFAFLSLFLTILHVLLVKGRDLVTFTWTEHSRLYIGVIVLLAVLFTYFFYLCLTHTLYYIGKKNKTFLSYFRFFIGYFLFMGVFWLLTWPGIFKGDEFYVIRAALSFTMSGAQSGITSLFYMVALLFFPSMASITFIQILLICTIFSVIMHDLFSVLSGQKTISLIFAVYPAACHRRQLIYPACHTGWLDLSVCPCKSLLSYQNRPFFRQMAFGPICPDRTSLCMAQRIYLSGRIPAPRIFTSEKNTSEAGSLYACVITCILYALQYTKQNCIKWKQ